MSFVLSFSFVNSVFMGDVQCQPVTCVSHVVHAYMGTCNNAFFFLKIKKKICKICSLKSGGDKPGEQWPAARRPETPTSLTLLPQQKRN